MTITIKHRITGAVLFTSETATTLGGAVIEAVKAKVVLRGAYLGDADLRDADLGGEGTPRHRRH